MQCRAALGAVWLASVAGNGGAGTVAGRVTLTGTAPERRPLPVTEKACHPGPFLDESVLAGPGGGLQNVFVRLVSPLPATRPPADKAIVRLEQHGCRFEPHVFGIRPGQPLEIINADPVLHNIHALAKRGREFNAAMPPRTAPWAIQRTFTAAETMVQIRCDVHGWMSAWAGVVDHPWFAVSGPDGRFTIPGVPPGTYDVEAWHEVYGVQRLRLTVRGRLAATAVFAYNAGTHRP